MKCQAGSVKKTKKIRENPGHCRLLGGQGSCLFRRLLIAEVGGLEDHSLEFLKIDREVRNRFATKYEQTNPYMGWGPPPNRPVGRYLR